MKTLIWTEEMALNLPVLDDTHREFVALLAELGQVLDGPQDPLPLFERLLTHTEAHFEMEAGWMAATGFAPDNCHSKQHAMVLDVMRQVLAHAQEQQDLNPLRNLLPELVNWFPAHAEMMDAALVFHMGQMGFDPATGRITKPIAATAQAISSCGSASCG